MPPTSKASILMQRRSSLLEAAEHGAKMASPKFFKHLVEDISVQRSCRQQPITAVNGTLQGPTINAREGEWWNANVVEVEHNATESQTAPISSAA
ncbi:hypothetical protein JHK87_001297 [Glycine soja]|nr:hypothetical protein JHK87_001297 [Glycine soja]